MTDTPDTPLMAQWRRLKQEAGSAWLFFRLGDFYELFGADAVEAAPILDVQLTSRDGQTPMCGVPFHALDVYLRRALEAGRAVAVAEQLEDPGSARGLVERGIVRTVTPGTFVPEEGEAAGPLAAVTARRDGFGLAFLYLGEGRATFWEYRGRDARRRLDDLLERAAPAEVLAPDPWPESRSRVTVRPDLFQAHDVEGGLRRLLGIPGLRAIGLEEWPWAQAALLAGLRYAEATQGRPGVAPDRIGPFPVEDRFWATSRVMQQLGILGSSPNLFERLDHTVTPMGRRRLREWLAAPLRDRAAIDLRLRAVACWKDRALVRERLRSALAGIGDAERRLARVDLGLTQPRDLARLARLTAALPQIEAVLRDVPEEGRPTGGLPDVTEVAERLGWMDPAAGVSWQGGGLIQTGVDAALDRLRALAGGQREALADLEQDLRRTTGIRTLKVGQHRTLGLYIEVPNGQLGQVPSDWRRKQSLTAASRFTMARLDELAGAMAEADSEAEAREAQLARVVEECVLDHRTALYALMDALTWLDAVQALAEAADRNRWVCPTFCPDDLPRLEADALRHPVVEHAVDSYVTSPLRLEPPTRIALITGPNMGGKSTFMRAVAQNVWLAQMGSFVAADSWRQPVLHGVYARIGAEDDVSRGQSTFMVEMQEMAQILAQADGQSLVVLDELGRGTSTFDGLALAWAIVEHLAAANPPPFTLFATHYHELVQLTGSAITALRTEAKVAGGRLVLLHQVVPGATSESFGIEVASQAGIPRAILRRADRLLRQWERDGRPRPLLDADQASWFEPDPVAEELKADLRRLDLTAMTPLDALMWLHEWQGRLS
jgi:DNA mismatch repair protein MutS